jgi:hypothetical protein
MLWFIQNIAFSISLIVIIHYLYLYFESTLTTPKVKDLIHCPKQKYNSLFETINSQINVSDTKDQNKEHLGILPRNSKNSVSGLDTGLDSNGPSMEPNTAMKNDLRSFLRTIGLKRQTTSEPPKAAYETN